MNSHRNANNKDASKIDLDDFQGIQLSPSFGKESADQKQQYTANYLERW